MPRKRPGEVLTDKQRSFCMEYIIDLHATHAAIRAGYTENSAATTASHLLDNQDILDFIQRLQEDKFLRLRLKADEILLELARIGFADMEDYYEEAKPAPEPKQSEPETAGSNDAGEKQALKDPRLNPRTALTYKRVITDPETGQKTTISFNLHHKIMALRILGMHYGLFAKPDGKKTGPVRFILPPKGNDPNPIVFNWD